MRKYAGAVALAIAATAAAQAQAATSPRGSAKERNAEGRLLSAPPVSLHPLATASPLALPDNTVKLVAPRVEPTTGGAETNGSFGSPFVEPKIGDTTTADKCIPTDAPNKGATGEKALTCKPAAGTLVNLPNGKILYWDALEGTENNKFSIVAEGGTTFTNDSSRLLDLGKDDANPSWTEPKNYDGGANPQGEKGAPVLPSTTETYNDGALFGSHESFLPDGKLLVQGGTDYSLEPGVNGIPFGAVELTGLKATRIYDPKTNEFTQTGDTASRRWYPTVIEGGDGTYYDFGGVGKLLKPVYTDTSGTSGTDASDSLQNVKKIERYDPKTGKWTMLPASADRDFPLYPRMHLLPDGHLYYNADGQDFNPFGQSINEAGWGELASLDPKTNAWTDLGLANTKTPTAPGFRASTSSTLLPLTPNADGSYTKARFLTAGGVLLPSPGSYLPTDQSSITTVDTGGGKEAVSQQATGPLNAPRWFGQNIQLPTGEVVVFSGADKDEVVGPGTEVAMQQTEIFDPKTNKWTPGATAHNPRTYHNTAVLLPSGEVLVGGHATISTLYLNNTTLPGGFAPHDGRDPSFEVYKPPYLFRGDRPVISMAPDLMGYGQTMDITLAPGTNTADIESVALVRNSAITHIVDADQRTIMLPVVARNGNVVTVATPPNGNVAPPGPYMVFVNKKGAQGSVPSVAKQLMVTTDSAAAERAAVKAASTTASKCVSRRAFTVHVRKGYLKRVRKVRVLVAGKAVKTVTGKRTRAAISLKGTPKSRVTVKLVMTLAGGRKVTDTRVYRTCTPKRK